MRDALVQRRVIHRFAEVVARAAASRSMRPRRRSRTAAAARSRRLGTVTAVGANAAKLFGPSGRPPIAHDGVGDRDASRAPHVVDAHDVDAGWAASAVVATVPYTRSDGSRPVSFPIVDFRDVPNIVGYPSATNRSSPRNTAIFWSAVFPKPIPGSRMTRPARDAARRRAPHCRPETRSTTSTTGPRGRIVLVVHGDERHFQLRDGVEELVGSAPDGVDEVGAGRVRGPHHRRLVRCLPRLGAAGDAFARLRGLRERRARSRRHRRSARGRGASTRRRLQRVGRRARSLRDRVLVAHRRIARSVARERVGRHVDDSHHVRPRAPRRLGSRTARRRGQARPRPRQYHSRVVRRRKSSP